MARFAILILVVLLDGCASSGIVITKNNNVINMPHFSIEAPPDQGWSLNVVDRTYSKFYLKKSINSTAYQMWFNINWVAGEHMKTWTAKQVADDYRNGELSDMHMQGVMAGMYELKDVQMGEEIVGDKTFYTMSYANIRGDMTQNSTLYLYFPKETDIGNFIVAIYTDGYRGKEMLSKSYKPDFISVLESLQVIKDNSPE